MMMALMSSFPEIGKVAGDLIVRQDGYSRRWKHWPLTVSQ
jgi:hypothetical protein